MQTSTAPRKAFADDGSQRSVRNRQGGDDDGDDEEHKGRAESWFPAYQDAVNFLGTFADPVHAHIEFRHTSDDEEEGKVVNGGAVVHDF